MSIVILETRKARQSKLIAPRNKFWHMKEYIEAFGDPKAPGNLKRGPVLDNQTTPAGVASSGLAACRRHNLVVLLRPVWVY